MKKLTEEQFNRAVDFVMTHARPVDQHLFNYYFNSGSKSKVLDSLTHFQNDDGGMGYGLEPDVRSPQSSPIATTIAMQYVRQVKASWRHPLVKKCMKYFTNTYKEHNNWPLTLQHMNDYPHAEWWHYSTFDETFSINPGVEIIGYYHAYPQSIPENLFPLFHDFIFQHIENKPAGIEFHELLCYTRLVEEMPDPGKSIINDYLRNTCRKIVTKDPKKWGGYCAKPIVLAPTPTSPLANVLDDVIQLNLDYEIDNQQIDGSWLPHWTWGQYQDTWENEASVEWQGYITVKTLITLQSYGRIEAF
ncbi:MULTISPECIES: hypothetical protein [Bacillaceae]|uniref:Uncharacterized protein n=1 Tax=Evansella alkalicola TaxID=745819 RepID=A0ABS6K042_9BACI|nr:MULTISPECIES: hypothetical protein [Bacillaceae]MBU9722832.1 hypothetical protein [Bacillus alkalicola]